MNGLNEREKRDLRDMFLEGFDATLDWVNAKVEEVYEKAFDEGKEEGISKTEASK